MPQIFFINLCSISYRKLFSMVVITVPDRRADIQAAILADGIGFCLYRKKHDAGLISFSPQGYELDFHTW